jgi:integrase/recombinase XerD
MAGTIIVVQGVQITGPLADYADDYGVKLKEHGYRPSSIIVGLRQVARLSRWLEVRQLGTADLGKERLDQFVCEQPRRRDGSRACSRRTLTQMLEVLDEQHGLERLDAVEGPNTGSEELLASFERFLLQKRSVASSTAGRYLEHVRCFLAWCGPNGDLAGLAASDVTDAVLREAEAVSANTAKLFVAALRSFLRFCFIEGLTPNDLSMAALSVAHRRSSRLPQGIGPRAADALMRSCDRRRSTGRRDYAILLILLRLGLRASEVTGLRLDDIDWRAGEIMVHGKGRREDRLPLPNDVGEAIAAYLRRGRPTITEHREVFLRAVPPIRPLQRTGISAIVQSACIRAGVPIVGVHRLRHTVACQMAEGGVPLPEIALVLRHHSISSTAEYARVDTEALRTVAQPWPGGGGR